MQKIFPSKVFVALLAVALMAPGLSAAVDEGLTPNHQRNITAIDDIKRGSMVTVKGTVERILDTDEFRLSDASGDVVVYVGYRNFVPVNEGETVTVTGFVDNDLLLEIYAREISHSDGRTTRFTTTG